MNKRVLLSAFLFWVVFFTTAQDHTAVDSLNALLEKPLADSTRIDILNDLAEEYFYIDRERMHELAIVALEQSEHINYRKGIAEAYNNLGTYHRVKGLYDESIDFFFMALEIMESLHDQAGIARSYNLIGILYYNLGSWDLSLEYYLKALEINYQQNDKKWIAGNSNNVGMIYERKADYEMAGEYYYKSLEMNLQLGNKNWLANNYGNIGRLYQLTNNPKSLDYFEQRLKITEEQKDTAGIAYSNQLIGNYFVYNKRLEESLPYLKKAYELAGIINSLAILSETSDKLSEVYAGLGDFKSALDYNKHNKVFSDSLNLSSNTEKITRLEMRYEHNKEKQLAELRYKQSKIIQSFIAVTLFLILIIILFFYNRQRNKSRRQQLEESRLQMDNRLLLEELDFKEKMLQENISYLLVINELLSQTISRFDKMKSASKPENRKIITDIIGTLQSGMNDDIWEEFEIRFNQIHKDFYDTLNETFPGLSANEKKLCAFLKLRMTSKEIAAITSLSIKSIETARSRLRKKLNIKDKSESISDFLDNF